MQIVRAGIDVAGIIRGCTIAQQVDAFASIVYDIVFTDSVLKRIICDDYARRLTARDRVLIDQIAV